jgi:heme/copper-type cytochrome/quinol oxidase subunit 4
VADQNITCNWTIIYDMLLRALIGLAQFLVQLVQGLTISGGLEKSIHDWFESFVLVVLTVESMGSYLILTHLDTLIHVGNTDHGESLLLFS